MSEPNAEPVYVSYPRKSFGRGYGTVERLEALGKFCTSFCWTFLGITCLIYFLEWCATAFFAGFGGKTEAYFLVTAVVAAAIARRVSYLGTALGWNRSIAIMIGLLFVLLSTLVVLGSNQPTVLWLLPWVALFIASVAGLHAAHQEMPRYGIKLSIFSNSTPKVQFTKALAERKAWEKALSVHGSPDLYSIEPPNL